MKLEIVARNIELTDTLRAYIQKRINFTLGNRFDQVKRIFIRLSDVNDSRGGQNQRCQILVSIPRLQDVLIEDTQSNLLVAVDRAVDRASRTVNRRLIRHYSNNRKLFIPATRDTSTDYEVNLPRSA